MLYDQTQPIDAPEPVNYGQPMHAQPPKKRQAGLLLGIVGGVVAALIAGVVAAVIAFTSGGSRQADAAAPAAPSASAAPATSVAAVAEVAEPTPTLAAVEPVVAPTPTKPAKVDFKKLTERQWKKIAKDPDAHTGEAYIVYGAVTQFDSATGVDIFRANVGAKNESENYDYDTNTILTGGGADLSDLVEDDEFRAQVLVTGSFSYDTQIGGETTVPQLEVRSIKVL